MALINTNSPVTTIPSSVDPDPSVPVRPPNLILDLQSPAVEFHLYQYLPLELRFKILKNLFPARRIYTIEPKLRSRCGGSDVSRYQFCHKTSMPIALQVNKLTREEALRHYQQTLFSESQTSRNGYKVVYIDFSVDVLYIRGKNVCDANFGTTSLQGSWELSSKVERLALDACVWTRYSDIPKNLLTAFPKLKALTIINCDEQHYMHVQQKVQLDVDGPQKMGIYPLEFIEDDPDHHYREHGETTTSVFRRFGQPIFRCTWHRPNRIEVLTTRNPFGNLDDPTTRDPLVTASFPSMTISIPTGPPYFSYQAQVSYSFKAIQANILKAFDDFQRGNPGKKLPVVEFGVAAVKEVETADNSGIARDPFVNLLGELPFFEE